MQRPSYPDSRSVRNYDGSRRYVAAVPGQYVVQQSQSFRTRQILQTEHS